MPKSVAICSLRNLAKAELACGTVVESRASISETDRVCTFAATRNVSTTRTTTAGEATRPARVLRRRQVSMERQSTAGPERRARRISPKAYNSEDRVRCTVDDREIRPIFTYPLAVAPWCKGAQPCAKPRRRQGIPLRRPRRLCVIMSSSGEIGGSPLGHTESRAIFPDDPS